MTRLVVCPGLAILTLSSGWCRPRCLLRFCLRCEERCFYTRVRNWVRLIRRIGRLRIIMMSKLIITTMRESSSSLKSYQTTNSWKCSQYKSRKDKDPSKEPDMSDVMDAIRLKGRDNARGPMPWSNSPNAGFTSPGTKPWLRIHDEYRDFSVETQENDPDSVLNYYRKLCFIRKQHPLMVCLPFHCSGYSC